MIELRTRLLFVCLFDCNQSPLHFLFFSMANANLEKKRFAKSFSFSHSHGHKPQK